MSDPEKALCIAALECAADQLREGGRAAVRLNIVVDKSMADTEQRMRDLAIKLRQELHR